MITWDDFEKLDIRVGTITGADDFPKARNPSYKLTIDFGSEGTKKSSAQITDHYSKDDLVGKQIIAVCNFPSKQIADFMSECLVLGIVGDNRGVILLRSDSEVVNGSKIG